MSYRRWEGLLKSVLFINDELLPVPYGSGSFYDIGMNR